MISRCIKQLKEQNYVAFVFEFIIVVVGVFVAIKASEEHEKARILVQQEIYIKRLAYDFENTRNNNLQVISAHEEKINVLNAAISILESSSVLTPEETNQLNRGLGISRQIFQPFMNTSTLDRLLSSGSTSILQNTRVRSQLNGFRFFLSYYDDEIQANNQQLILMTQPLTSIFAVGEKHYEGGEEIYIDYDFTALKENLTVRYILKNVVSATVNNRTRLLLVNDGLEKMLSCLNEFERLKVTECNI